MLKMQIVFYNYVEEEKGVIKSYPWTFGSLNWKFPLISWDIRQS